jgi:hypothetical protein
VTELDRGLAVLSRPVGSLYVFHPDGEEVAPPRACVRLREGTAGQSPDDRDRAGARGAFRSGCGEVYVSGRRRVAWRVRTGFAKQTPPDWV